MYVYPQVRTTLASAVEAKVTAGSSLCCPGLHNQSALTQEDPLVAGLIRTLNLILETLNTIYPDAYQAIREVVKKDALVHHRRHSSDEYA
jgi:hypothetical protein